MSKQLYWDETPAERRARKLLAAKLWRESNMEKARAYGLRYRTEGVQGYPRERAAPKPAVDTTPRPVTLAVVAWLLRTTGPARAYGTVPKDI